MFKWENTLHGRLLATWPATSNIFHGSAVHGSSLEVMMQDGRAVLNDQHLDPLSLEGQRQQRKDKAERMASVLKGRQTRSFVYPCPVSGL